LPEFWRLLSAPFLWVALLLKPVIGHFAGGSVEGVIAVIRGFDLVFDPALYR
jgi:hypothetical protein